MVVGFVIVWRFIFGRSKLVTYFNLRFGEKQLFFPFCRADRTGSGVRLSFVTDFLILDSFFVFCFFLEYWLLFLSLVKPKMFVFFTMYLR